MNRVMLEADFSLFNKENASFIAISLLMLALIPPALLVARWSLFLLLGLLLSLFRLYFTVYHGFRIFMDALVLTTLKLYMLFKRRFMSYMRSTTHMKELHKKMKIASAYDEWLHYFDENESHRQKIAGEMHMESEYQSLDLLRATTAKLKDLRMAHDYAVLMHDIPSIVKRNYLGIDDVILTDRRATKQTQEAIAEYHREICSCIEGICSDGSNTSGAEGVTHVSSMSRGGGVNDQTTRKPIDREHKIRFLKKLSRNIGHSALCLSGGGAICMYHMGVLRALISQNLYADVHVISGASGGSIAAAMCAIKTEDELLRDCLVDNVSTDYRGDGSMKRYNISWFPPVWTQMIHFLRTGYLIDNKGFQKTCDYYWGDTTFEEAYARTHKHVCITVTASNTSGGGAVGEKLLLNHLSTPHVLIRSAVAASCALPGIMKPNKLLCKTNGGEVVPFESNGSEWVDGSIGADVPFKRMSALFSVSNFIVSQVNFHIVPFVSHRAPSVQASTGTIDAAVRMAMSYLESDLAYRTEQLKNMKLLPRLYGQEINGVFKQKYHGHITIVPELRWGDTFGINAIVNPQVTDMQQYLRGGEQATWSGLRQINHVLCIERCIWESLRTLVTDDELSVTDVMRDGRSGGTHLRHASVSDLLVYGHVEDEPLSRNNSLSFGLPLSRSTSLTPSHGSGGTTSSNGDDLFNIQKYAKKGTIIGSGAGVPDKLSSAFHSGFNDTFDEFLDGGMSVRTLLARVQQLEEENQRLKDRIELGEKA